MNQVVHIMVKYQIQDSRAGMCIRIDNNGNNKGGRHLLSAYSGRDCGLSASVQYLV